MAHHRQATVDEHLLVDCQWQATVGPSTALSLVAHRRQATVGGNLVMDRRWPDISFPPWVASDGGLLVAYYRRPEGTRAQVGPPVDMNP